jgi:hypothetical protein
MAHALSAGMLAQTLSARLSPVMLVELDTAHGIIFVWSGIGTILFNGNTFQGVGRFGGVDGITEATAVQASGATLTLSGIPLDLISVALQSLRRYLPCRVWVGAMDDNGNLVSTPFLIRNGRVDSSSISTGADTATITVNVESRLIAMQNPRVRRYTDQDQKIYSPSDDGFKYVDQLQNVSFQWGSIVV